MIPIKAHRPFEMVTFDIMGPIWPLADDGGKYVLVLIDHFTKWAECFALKDQTAVSVANVIFQEYICTHGCPEKILSDRGRNFNRDIMVALANLLDVNKLNTTPYRPQCDGQTERFNRTLGAMLRAVIGEHPNKWSSLLKPLSFAYNTAVHKTTGVQPFVMLFGRFPRLPADLIYPTFPLHKELVEHEYADNICNSLRDVYAVVRAHRDVQVDKQKFFHDRNVKCAEYKLGERVYCRVEAPPSKSMGKKLTTKYDGPYEVIGTMTIRDEDGNSIVDYKIKPERGGRSKTVHASKLKKCFSPKVEVVRAPRQRRSSFLTRSELIAEDKSNGDTGVLTNGEGLELDDDEQDVFMGSGNDDDENLIRLNALMDKFSDNLVDFEQSNEIMRDETESTEKNNSNVLNEDTDDDAHNEDLYIEDDYIEPLQEEELDKFLDDIEVELDGLSKDISESKVTKEDTYKPNYYYDKQCEQIQRVERPRRDTRPIERLGIQI